MPDLATRQRLTVSLAELNAAAALLTRADRKYAVPADSLMAALAEIRTARTLEIASRTEFAYDSTYFDTDDLLLFRLAAGGRRRRFKVRTRAYLDSGEMWLEVKTKGTRGRTVKDRVPYSSDGRATLTAAGRAFLESVLKARGINPRPTHELRAALHVRFRRTTLLLPDAASRATIDRRISVFDGSTAADFADAIIVETKTSGPPSALDRALWARGHRPQRISKYTIGTATLRPELSANRWHRCLSGPLTTTPHPLQIGACP